MYFWLQITYKLQLLITNKFNYLKEIRNSNKNSRDVDVIAAKHKVFCGTLKTNKIYCGIKLEKDRHVYLYPFFFILFRAKKTQLEVTVNSIVQETLIKLISYTHFHLFQVLMTELGFNINLKWTDSRERVQLKEKLESCGQKLMCFNLAGLSSYYNRFSNELWNTNNNADISITRRSLLPNVLLITNVKIIISDIVFIVVPHELLHTTSSFYRLF